MQLHFQRMLAHSECERGLGKHLATSVADACSQPFILDAEKHVPAWKAVPCKGPVSPLSTRFMKGD